MTEIKKKKKSHTEIVERRKIAMKYVHSDTICNFVF